MIELVNSVTERTIKVPTVGENIPTDYFEKCVANVGVAKYHAVVALIYKDKLSLLFSTYKGKKNNAMFASVTPILVKADIDAIQEVIPGIKIGNPVIAGSSALSMGHHITCKDNYLEIENVMRHIESDTTKTLTKAVSLGGKFSEPICKFVEFKLIPYAEIKGFYSVNSKE